jgi:hypothetical protein
MTKIATPIATTDEKTSPAPATNVEVVGGELVTCGRCGTRAPKPGDGIGFSCPKCKAFLPGHSANLRHGLRRFQRRGVITEDLRQDVESFRTNLIADVAGSPDGLNTITAALCRLLVIVEVCVRLNQNSLVDFGVDTGQGKAAHERLLAAIDRWLRISERLQIEARSQRPVLNVAEQFAQLHRRSADRKDT